MGTINSGKGVWLGGYIRHGKKRPTFVIEKRIGGRKFHVSTRCHTERAALEQLEIFEADPAGYSPGRAAVEPGRVGRLRLSLPLVQEYRDWMLSRDKPASREWALTCAGFLVDWMEDFGGLDLRDVSVAKHLKPALARRKTSRKHRVEAIKAFYAWLRKERGLLRHAEDPTLDLPVPQTPPEKWKRRKVVDRKRILAALPHLPDATRDVLLLQMGTAWHVSEVRRFAGAGEIRALKEGELLGVLHVRHKSGELTRTPLVHQEHLEAAQRIQKRGKIPGNHRLAADMRKACVAAEVAPFFLGAMRHTVLTWAVEAGSGIQQVSEFAHHRSVATTKRFYVDLGEPVAPVRVFTVIDGGKKETA